MVTCNSATKFKTNIKQNPFCFFPRFHLATIINELLNNIAFFASNMSLAQKLPCWLGAWCWGIDGLLLTKISVGRWENFDKLGFYAFLNNTSLLTNSILERKSIGTTRKRQFTKCWWIIAQSLSITIGSRIWMATARHESHAVPT